MNRSLAQWLANNPGGAVLVTGLLGLLPLFGVGIAFFLPGAVPALLVLTRGARIGTIVVLGASLLLAGAMLAAGRPMAVGFIYATWVLVPPLLVAMLLGKSESMSLCLQVATLAGAVALVLLHGMLGNPQQFWAPFMRDLANAIGPHDLPMGVDKGDFLELLARSLWGWMAVLTVLIAALALFLARWLQSSLSQAVQFGVEFRQIRLGMALGAVAGLVIVGSMLTKSLLLDDVRNVFVGSLFIVGLAALHTAVATGRLRAFWLWIVYMSIALLVTALPVVIGLAAWGFIDNWFRSQRAIRHVAAP